MNISLFRPNLPGIDRLVLEIERAFRRSSEPLKYTVATLPDAALNEGLQVYVSNEAGGATLAFSDATNWRRAQDRAVVS